MVIYKIIIQGTDRFYIGSAVDFHKRRLHHLSQLRIESHRNTHLQRCFKKYGEDSFSFEVLEEVEGDNKLLLEREQAWIDKYDFEQLINICPVAGNTFGRKHTAETRRKLSENHADVSGKNNPMYGRSGPLAPNYGKPRSEETKRKISEANKGRPCVWKGKKRPELSKKMSGKNNHMYGKKLNAKARKAISEARKRAYREKGGEKLNFTLAKEMRKRYNEEKITITALAKEYGISRTYCGLVLRGKYWNEQEEN